VQSHAVHISQDTERPHFVTRAIEAINKLGWELLEHPLYSHDLAPSNYHLFSALKFQTRSIYSSKDSWQSQNYCE